MVGTVASLLVLINTVGLVSWTGLPGLTMRRIFGCPDGSHRTDAFNGKLSWVTSYASQDGCLLILIAELYSYWLLHPIA